MQLHRKPDPNDRIGFSGCLQVMLLAAVVIGVGTVVVFVVSVVL